MLRSAEAEAIPSALVDSASTHGAQAGGGGLATGADVLNMFRTAAATINPADGTSARSVERSKSKDAATAATASGSMTWSVQGGEFLLGSEAQEGKDDQGQDVVMRPAPAAAASMTTAGEDKAGEDGAAKETKTKKETRTRRPALHLRCQQINSRCSSLVCYGLRFFSTKGFVGFAFGAIRER